MLALLIGAYQKKAKIGPFSLIFPMNSSSMIFSFYDEHLGR